MRKREREKEDRTAVIDLYASASLVRMSRDRSTVQIGAKFYFQRAIKERKNKSCGG